MPVGRPSTDSFDRHLKGLAAQALTDWEAIFVLDGPNQEARKAILKTFPNFQNIEIVEIEKSGPQAARNKGAEFAQGDIFCFLDSDCALEPGASKMWVDQFDKRPEIGFIYSGYKFFGDKFAIESEPWDPWTLKVRNYISGCFPMRKELYPGWAPELKSLQDWDMWLSLVEKAESKGWDVKKLGLFIRGYAFTTAMPDANSVSGSYGQDKWLERMDAVKSRHKITDKSVCVASLTSRVDGIALAKLIGADFQTFPCDKPHRYQTIVQIGFSLGKDAEKHAAIFGGKEVKKILFWTGENICEIYNGVSFQQIDAMSQVLNDTVTQFCEDEEAKKLLTRAGFKVEVKALPVGEVNILPLPAEKKWAIDMGGAYSPMISVVAQSLPDIPIEMIGAQAKLEDYVGLLHFFPDRTLTSTAKRALMTGRHVVSNIQAPFCGFVDDKWDKEKFVVEVVDKIREMTAAKPNEDAAKYYAGIGELAGVL